MKTMNLKKVLVIIFALCFTLTACSKSTTDGGTIAPGDEASIGNTGYATLQEAIKAVADDDIVTLLTDITLEAPVYIGSETSFTLDLNGKTLDGGSNMAIQHDGTGVLSITDSSGGGVSIGQVKSAGGEDVPTVGLGNGGHLVLSDSAMITAEGGGIGIYNIGSGSVFIAGGDVNAISGGTAIKNGEGDVTVAGGAVGSTDGGYGIWNAENGIVNISGGSVYSDGRYSAAIYNFAKGSVNMNGGMVSCDGSDSHAILNNDTGLVAIAGGTIRNNYDMGTAICNEYGGTVSILDGTIPTIDNGEPPTIIGGGMAIDAAPVLGTGVKVTASSDASGTPTVAYNAKNITQYKYLKFEQGSTSSQTSDETNNNLDAVAAAGNTTTSGTPETSDKKDTKVYEITPESSGPYDPGYTVRFVIVTGDAVTKVEYGHFLQDGVITLTTPSQTKYNLNYWYVDIVMPGVGEEQRTVTFFAKGYDGSKEVGMVFTDVLINAGDLEG